MRRSLSFRNTLQSGIQNNTKAVEMADYRHFTFQQRLLSPGLTKALDTKTIAVRPKLALIVTQSRHDAAPQ